MTTSLPVQVIFRLEDNEIVCVDCITTLSPQVGVKFALLVGLVFVQVEVEDQLPLVMDLKRKACAGKENAVSKKKKIARLAKPKTRAASF